MKRATVIPAVAFVVFSCRSNISVSEKRNFKDAPVQVVEDMFVVQSDKGIMQMRVEASVMERYQSDTLDWEVFPAGFRSYAYNESGLLETEIKADQARHTAPKNGKPEIWAAFGNVSVKNLINRETMETDTLYWDRQNEKIYTDCYVRLLSPDGFMQGYGMESDQRGRNSVILRPFNSYGIIDNDSTSVVIDSVNFIGPFPKK